MAAGVASSVRVELGWPAAELSPNARIHPMKAHSFKKAAKHEAGWATHIALGRNDFWHGGGKIPVRIIAHPPMAWRTGDSDNFIARLKWHLDSIAKALGVNDRHFDQQGVTWAERRERPVVIIEIGAAS